MEQNDKLWLLLSHKVVYDFCALQRIQYARKDSDVIAKMKGTFVERPKKKPEDYQLGKKKKAAPPQKYDFNFQ